MSQKPISRNKNIILQEFTDEVLIYDLDVNKAYCLNQISASVWYECDGKKTVAEISQTLRRKLKNNVSEDVVWLAINQFKTDKLLENKELATPFDGLSRREVVKRIGFASMVALPIIASVVAPNSLQAQSVVCDCASTAPNARPPGCACTMDVECCSGFCAAGGITCANSLSIGPGCCPAAADCSAFPLAPGCTCLNNGDCASGSCNGSSNRCNF
jgi:hypothetical protein